MSIHSRSDLRPSTLIPGRALAEQVFSRAAGAPLKPGNRIRLLIDADENYPAWMECLESATETINFEMYFIHEDRVGLEFAEILIRKARQGVRVRLVYDWLGCLFKASGRFWQRLRRAGVDVRCFNPPRLDSPIGWLSRNHRKSIVVDGKVAFVTGLCVGQMWSGYPERSIKPWRDTGVEVRGPAVYDIEKAFYEVWADAGIQSSSDEPVARDNMESEGDVALRVIATVPNTANIYRLDTLVAALARRTLWLSDAYFMGGSSYIQALRSAALDGVDVRLLVPGSTDIPILRAISMTGYQPLLESGVRVFEWNGSMMHAKTAVADGMWARVGSTNLNIASWMGNYELDVAVEDAGFAQSMEEMFLRDLENSREVVLRKPKRVESLRRKQGAFGSHAKVPPRGIARTSAGTIRFGYNLGSVFSEHRILGQAEANITGISGILLLIIALAGFLWPPILSIPIGIICGWFALSLLIRTFKLIYGRKKEYDRRSGDNRSPPL
ncbi:MAG: phospholipase D-like domain-containing protein [Syntrophales bacterium]|nr:phospholipase D-like domain-containing protein [Syntrophales bacterium]